MGKYFLRCLAIFACIFLSPSYLSSQDLKLSPDDLRIELRADGGYPLFIRYKPDLSSVLLTESTRDPEFRANNYAYRAEEWNAINGDEIRIINGQPVSKTNNLFSLVSSTPTYHPVLGWAYHIYIPEKLLYGYEGGRQGEVHVGDGTYLNVRAFYYAHADYRGAFMDNPFILRTSQDAQRPAPAGTHLPETVAAFTEIAGGNAMRAGGPLDLVERIRSILKEEAGKTVDIVICIDATASMRPYIDALREGLIPMLEEMITNFESFRIGLVPYRDYYEEFITRIFPFTSDFDLFQRQLNAVRVTGGGDVPEAVYEALYDSATKFPWEADSKVLILIGDAPPHPRPRGRITKQMVDGEVARQGIQVHAIILPQ
jgi:Mg-chelatase subunit ChlD